MSTAREFFRKESDEYVSGLRTLLEDTPPDTGEMRRLARALRGCAQMAREDGVYRGARIFEAATRELAEGRLAWDERARGHVGATLDDLWSLVESGEADVPEAQAVERIAAIRGRWQELGIAVEDAGIPGAAPDDARAATVAEAPPALRDYAAREVEGILEVMNEAIRDLRQDGLDREPLKRILLRQRALLGAAGLPALSAVSDPLQIMDETARLAASQNRPVEGPWLEVFEQARAALSEAAESLAAGAVPPDGTPTLERLRALREQLVEGRAAEPGDAEEEAEEIPVEVVNFFRTEARARLEKLRKTAEEMESRPEAEGELSEQLREGLAGLAQTAGTFGFVPVSREIERAAARIGEIRPGDAKVLVATLEGAVEAALSRSGEDAPSEEALPPLPSAPAASAPETPSDEAAGPGESSFFRPLAQPTSQEPAPEQPGRAIPAAAAPAGGEAAAPEAEDPAAQPKGPLVPLEDLCYSGEAALRRALELRPALEKALAEGRPPQDLLDEIFDLIRLGTP